MFAAAIGSDRQSGDRASLEGSGRRRHRHRPVAGDVPDLVGEVKPVRYESATRQLDLPPASPAYATQLRLLEGS
jgi:hypothetical protein